MNRKHNSITLVILAAGMGSRYGGLKQLEPVGDHGETIMDFSIKDALEAGFKKIVFVIREKFLDEFEKRFSKLRLKVHVEFAFQKVNPQIEGITYTAREKPWGPVHAMLSAADKINEPFAVINADDLYGKDAFTRMADFLKNDCSTCHHAMIGYVLKNTLSAFGGVSRGVCEADETGYLKIILECGNIERKDGKVGFGKDGHRKILDENAIVSMNFWGFHPSYLEFARNEFLRFVSENANNPVAEMVLAAAIQPLVATGKIKVSVLETNAQWMGVTYREDRDHVKEKLKDRFQNN